MLRLPIIGLFLRTIPEGILGMYAIYVFIGKKFEWEKIIGLGVVFGTLVYFIRLLPISFGVHTIVGLLIYMFLVIRFIKLKTFTAITCCIMYIILGFLCEAVTIPSFPKLLGVPIEEVLKDPTKLVIFSMPSLLLTFLVLLIVYLLRNNYKKGISGGKR